MTTEARAAGVVARRIHLVVAIDRLLARLLATAPPGSWVVKGGYANQLRRPERARITEDLDLRIDAAIEAAPEVLAAGVAADGDDDFTYDVAAAAAPLLGPPWGACGSSSSRGSASRRPGSPSIRSAGTSRNSSTR